VKLQVQLWIVLLLAAIVGMLLADHQGMIFADEPGPRRRVILVGGICSQSPAQSMEEIYLWLRNDLRYDPDEIILFDYRGTTPLASPSKTYNQDATWNSIDGEGGSADHLSGMIEILTKATPGEQFDIIAHSQGGVVSLYAALKPATAARINSIVTIESPVQGITAMAYFLSNFTCANSLRPSVVDMRPISPVISKIGINNWSNLTTPFVVTMANTEDPVISNVISANGFPNGESGVLDNAHEQVQENLGGELLTAHGVPLNIISNSAAAPVRNKLLRALVEYQLEDVFLASPNGFISDLQSPPISPAPLTASFVGNAKRLTIADHPQSHPSHGKFRG